MPSQVKKPIIPAGKSSAGAHAKFHPAFPAAGAMQKAESRMMEAGRKNMEEWMHSSESLNKMAGECAGICSGNMNAVAESGGKISRVAQDCLGEIMRGYNDLFSDWAEFSRDALACRTINDALELQNHAAQQWAEHYLRMAGKLSNIMFDGYGEALDPITERVAIASEQIRKALAA